MRARLCVRVAERLLDGLLQRRDVSLQHVRGPRVQQLVHELAALPATPTNKSRQFSEAVLMRLYKTVW